MDPALIKGSSENVKSEWCSRIFYHFIGLPKNKLVKQNIRKPVMVSIVIWN